MRTKMNNLAVKIFLILVAAIVLGVVALTIYVFIVYGGKPITEIPSWAVWFMMPKK